MGESFETIVDVDASAEDAERLGDRVATWLAGEGVVLPARSDCVLGPVPGRAPGPQCLAAFANPSTDDRERLHGLRTNGLEVVTGRTVFWSWAPETVACPRCRWCLLASAEDGWNSVSDTIGEWFEGSDGILTCGGCGRRNGLNDWAWDPPWAFAHLGFTFWNWPPLSRDFVARVSGVLGHRTVHTSGRL